MNKKKATTIAELGIVLIITGFLALISITVFGVVLPKVSKLKFKNANLSFKHAMNILISNPIYFSPEGDLSDTSDIELQDIDGGPSIRYGGDVKFRHLLFREMGIPLADNIDCYMLVDSKTPQSRKWCYQADNGIVWAVPETDFITKGVVEQKNAQGVVSKYVPITIYPDFSSKMTSNDFYQKAIVMGVRRDGALTLIESDTVNCKKNEYKNFAQCQIADMFGSLNANFTD